MDRQYLAVSLLAVMGPALNHSEIPSVPPPPGIIPNFVDPKTNDQITTIVISILLPLMLVFIVIRLYHCLRINDKIAKSDCKSNDSTVLGSLLMATRRLLSSCGMHIPPNSNTNRSLFLTLGGLDLIHFCYVSWYTCPYPQRVISPV